MMSVSIVVVVTIETEKKDEGCSTVVVVDGWCRIDAMGDAAC